MQVSLNESQLEDLKTILNKLIQSFDNFCQSIENLNRSVNKLTEKIDKKSP